MQPEGFWPLSFVPVGPPDLSLETSPVSALRLGVAARSAAPPGLGLAVGGRAFLREPFGPLARLGSQP
eukprot:7604360-Alexandrium_andersonii.AAC.1